MGHNCEWYRHALQNIHHPVALVGADHNFTWCNAAYEQLVGYSEAELVNKTWMEITEDTDVGGDMSAAKSVIDGERNSYTTAKKYRHKSGCLVPIALTVWRYPPGGGDLLGFSVEAIPTAEVLNLQEIHKRHITELEGLTQRIDKLEASAELWRAIGVWLLKWSPIIGGSLAAVAWTVDRFF